ncbi:MAG: hypothetical protein KH452_00760 [Clostridiales bacterium]|nr:hypothetical protein [Clostridiales bacterium]
MSYCIKCGVELDSTCTVCPLCNTKVYHPEITPDLMSPTPFPTKKGNAAPVQRSDTTILISVILAVTAVVCGLLNLLVFKNSAWSLYVIGGCALLWVFCLPVFFLWLNRYISILLDGFGIALYFGMIAFLHPGRGWYTSLALPVVVLASGLLMLFLFCVRRKHASILLRSVVILAETAVFAAALELLIDHYRGIPLGLSWSAVVLTCCVIIDAALVTIIRRSRLREEVRRRMHI